MKKFANERGTVAGLQRDSGTHDYERPGKCPNWLDSFAKNYHAKTVVEQTRERNSQYHSLHDQINSLVNNSPLKTVDSVVQDMQERTGIAGYVRNVRAQEEADKKKALASLAAKVSTAGEQPDLFDDIPEARSFIDNMAKGSHGTLAVEAIVESLKDCYSKHPEFSVVKAEDNTLREYINDQLVTHSGSRADDNDANIGTPEVQPTNENDKDNTDMFANIGEI